MDDESLHRSERRDVPRAAPIDCYWYRFGWTKYPIGAAHENAWLGFDCRSHWSSRTGGTD
jgi:hypothetical protein